MTSKRFNSLLLFALFGIAMWFFGNLYEAIVIGPNILHDTAVSLGHWQSFFAVTNPAFFYVPVPQLATVVLIILFFKAGGQGPELKHYLKWATIFQVASIVLSVYIITQINFKLFFGDLTKYADRLYSLALLWNILNLIRIALVGIALVFLFKAYLQAQKKS